jgi:hypothetical protein
VLVFLLLQRREDGRLAILERRFNHLFGGLII